MHSLATPILRALRAAARSTLLRQSNRLVLLLCGMLGTLVLPQVAPAQITSDRWSLWVRYDLDGDGKQQDILATNFLDTTNHSDAVIYGGAAGWCGKPAHKTKYPTPAGTEVFHVHLNFALTDAHIAGNWHMSGYPEQSVTVSTAKIDAYFDQPANFDIGGVGSKHTKLSSADHTYNCFAHACGYDVFILEQELPAPIGDAFGASVIRDEDYISRGSVLADPVFVNDVLFLDLQGSKPHAQLVKAVTTDAGYLWTSYYVTKMTEKDGESGVYQWHDPNNGFKTYSAYKKRP
jgi:hypothetical protein